MYPVVFLRRLQQIKERCPKKGGPDLEVIRATRQSTGLIKSTGCRGWPHNRQRAHLNPSPHIDHHPECFGKTSSPFYCSSIFIHLDPGSHGRLVGREADLQERWVGVCVWTVAWGHSPPAPLWASLKQQAQNPLPPGHGSLQYTSCILDEPQRLPPRAPTRASSGAWAGVPARCARREGADWLAQLPGPTAACTSAFSNNWSASLVIKALHRMS